MGAPATANALENADTAVSGVRGDIFRRTELPASTAGTTARIQHTAFEVAAANWKSQVSARCYEESPTAHHSLEFTDVKRG